MERTHPAGGRVRSTLLTGGRVVLERDVRIPMRDGVALSAAAAGGKIRQVARDQVVRERHRVRALICTCRSPPTSQSVTASRTAR